MSNDHDDSPTMGLYGQFSGVVNFRGKPILSKFACFFICDIRLLFHNALVLYVYNPIHVVYICMFLFFAPNTSAKTVKMIVAWTFPLLEFYINYNVSYRIRHLPLINDHTNIN